MYAYTNILAALILRGKNGRGCRIDVSMLESMVEWMSYPLYYAYDGAPPPPRAGASHATIIRMAVVAGDGKIVIVGLQNDASGSPFAARSLAHRILRMIRAFPRVPNEAAAREACMRSSSSFAPFTVEQVIEKTRASANRNARMNDMHEVWAHEQLKAAAMDQVDTQVGKIPALLPPGTGRSRARMDAIPSRSHTDSSSRDWATTNSGDRATQSATARLTASSSLPRRREPSVLVRYHLQFAARLDVMSKADH